MTTKIQSLTTQIKSYLPPAEWEEFKRLLRLSMACKAQQKIVDLLELMVEWRMDGRSLCAGIVYVLCESGWTRIQLQERKVSEIVISTYEEIQRLTVLLSGDSHPHSARQQGYIAAYTQLHTMIVTLGIHLINLPSIDQMTTAERRHWAERNLSVYLHLFVLLGFNSYAHLIADISLRLLDKAAYSRLEKQIDAYYARWQPLFQQVKRRLRKVSDGVMLETFRPQEVNPASLHPQGCDLLPVNTDHLVMDVIVDDLADCYAVMHAIHSMAADTPHVQDTLQCASLSGQRMLKTTLTDARTRQRLTFQIRTQSIDKVNHYGWIAINLSGEKVPGTLWEGWIGTQLEDVQKSFVTVFTPNGALVPVQPGATALDFAFKLHSQRAQYVRSFWLNGQRVPIHREVRTFDLVYVEYDPVMPTLKPEWLEKATLTKTRQIIRKQLASPTHAGMHHFYRVLDRELAIYHLSMDHDELVNHLGRVGKQHHLETIEQVWQALEQGKLAVDYVVNQLVDAKLLPHITVAQGKSWPLDRMRIARTWMQLRGAEKWSRERRVLPGVPLVGRSIQRKGKPHLLIYRQDDPYAPYGDAAIPLVWKSYTEQRLYEVQLHLRAQQSDSLTLLTALHEALPKVELLAFERTVNNHAVQLQWLLRIEDEHKLQQFLDGLKSDETITEHSLWQVLPGKKLRYTDDTRHRAENPYSLNHVGHSRMFFGRQREIESILDNLKKGNRFIVLYGEKRIGKTSLMHHLAANQITEEGDWLPVLFDSLSVANFDTTRFMAGLADAALRVVKPQVKHTAYQRIQHQLPDFSENAFVAFADWVRGVELYLHGRRLLFMVDEFTRAEDAYENGRIDSDFFGGMQWLVEHQEMPMVICVHKHIYRSGLSSWNFLQHGTPADLRPLDLVAARRLIHEPLSRHYPLDARVTERILELTAGHPYFVQGLCIELWDHLVQHEQEKITDQELNIALNYMLTKGDHFFAHYYGGADAFITDVLKSIAYMSTDKQPFVGRDVINQAMVELSGQSDTKRIAYSLNELIRRGAVEGKYGSVQNTYRITIPLLELWLKQLTHPLISKELRAHS